MVNGKFVASVGTIDEQNIEDHPHGAGFGLLEVKLRMDASGLATAEIPFVSGNVRYYAVKRGTGGDQPGQAFDLILTAKYGRLAAIAQTILTAAAISADVAKTLISGSQIAFGALEVKLQNSGAANSGKTATIVIAIAPEAVAG
jgi:hypothetical protein